MINNRRNFYRILHIQPEAPAEIIKASYRSLMTKLNVHPDRGGDHESAVLINQAYAVLIDPQKRRKYDEMLLSRHSSAMSNLYRKCPIAKIGRQLQIEPMLTGTLGILSVRLPNQIDGTVFSVEQNIPVMSINTAFAAKALWLRCSHHLTPDDGSYSEGGQCPASQKWESLLYIQAGRIQVTQASCGIYQHWA